MVDGRDDPRDGRFERWGPMDLEDYLRESALWERRHEWISGHTRPVAARPVRVALLGVPLMCVVDHAVRGAGGRTLASPMRIHIPAIDALVYTGLSVVYRPVQLSALDGDSLANPAIVGQALPEREISESFDRFRSLPSLRDMIFAEPDRRVVVHYSRPAEAWVRTEHQSDGIDLVSPSIAPVRVHALFDALDEVAITP